MVGPREPYYLLHELDIKTELVEKATQDIGTVLKFSYNLYFLMVAHYLAQLYFQRDHKDYDLYKECYDELIFNPPAFTPTALISLEIVPNFEGIYRRTESNVRLLKQLQQS